MVMNPLIKKAYWSLAAMGALYFVFLGCLANPWVQRNAIYMNLLKVTWRQDLTKPEEFGFAKNQVTPFFLDTPDGEKIFAWHVLPLGLYKAHRDDLVKQPDGIPENVLQSEGIKLLMSDPEARLIIHFHGNAGTVGATWRPTYLRSLSAADPSKIHILTIDYRGFGLSSGTPSEHGLITDGLTAVHWALDTLGLPPSHVALVGQSLGTAVTFGVAESLITQPRPVELGAIITIAAFTNIKELVVTYAIGGVVPILSPLRPYPFLQKLFSGFIVERWESDERVKTLVKQSKKLKLILLHAYNDFDIPWSHCDRLFYVAANATGEEALSWTEVQRVKERTDYGVESYQHRWPGAKSGGNEIEQWVVTWGGHNQVVTSAGTSVIVAKALGL
ncbi:uncharacterized protein LAJ45_09817 [Morchella importuna]|nr:uncharacterized protein LAJ45_09817 [Morchella importuna]KAH8146127.1 hypothetical protein LAJ45_09817 [Morchella importuna]